MDWPRIAEVLSPMVSMARATCAEIGVLIVDDMTFNGMPPYGVAPHQHARAHVRKTKEVQIDGAQMNGLRKIPIRERDNDIKTGDG